MPFDPNTYLASKSKAAAAPIPQLQGGGFDPNQYLRSKTTAQNSNVSEDLAPKTLQEMHPDFTTADRLVVQNFSNDPEHAVSYLQKKHPGLEVTIDQASGQIKARKKNGQERNYRVLDPNTGIDFTNGEIFRDIGDIGSDVVSGVGTSLATAAGGVLGAGAGGVGALPAGAAAGAAASGGIESVRQLLGKALGVNQDMNLTDIGVSTAAGGLSPLLFGTGAGAKQIAKLGLDEAGAKAAELAQRGGVGRLWDSAKAGVLPWLGEKASGVSKTAIKTLGSSMDTIKSMEQDPSAITNFTKEAAQSVGKTLREAKNAEWKTVEEGTKAVGDALVDVSGSRQTVENAIIEAEKNAAATGNEASKSLVTKLKEVHNKYFVATETQMGEDGVPQLVTKQIDSLPTSAATQLDRQLGELAGLGKQTAGDIKGGVGNRYAPTASFEDKAVGQVAGDAKSKLTAALQTVLPEDVMAARGRYGEIANLEKQVRPLLKNPDKAFRTLRNLDKPANQAKQELFNTLDQNFGTSLMDKAKLAEAYQAFAKPNALPVSSSGTTSTSRSIPLSLAGGAAGYYLGRTQGEGSGYGTGIAGAMLGATLGGPAAIRKYIEAGLLAGRMNRGLGVAPQAIMKQAVTEPGLGELWKQLGGNK